MPFYNMRNEFKHLVGGGHLELTYLDASSHFSEHFSVMAQVPLHVKNWSIFLSTILTKEVTLNVLPSVTKKVVNRHTSLTTKK